MTSTRGGSPASTWGSSIPSPLRAGMRLCSCRGGRSAPRSASISPTRKPGRPTWVGRHLGGASAGHVGGASSGPRSAALRPSIAAEYASLTTRPPRALSPGPSSAASARSRSVTSPGSPLEAWDATRTSAYGNGDAPTSSARCATKPKPPASRSSWSTNAPPRRPAPSAGPAPRSHGDGTSRAHLVGTKSTATSSVLATSPHIAAGPRALPCASRTVEQATYLPGVTGADTSGISAGPARHQAAPSPRGVAHRRTQPKPPLRRRLTTIPMVTRRGSRKQPDHVSNTCATVH